MTRSSIRSAGVRKRGAALVPITWVLGSPRVGCRRGRRALTAGAQPVPLQSLEHDRRAIVGGLCDGWSLIRATAADRSADVMRCPRPSSPRLASPTLRLAPSPGPGGGGPALFVVLDPKAVRRIRRGQRSAPAGGGRRGLQVPLGRLACRLPRSERAHERPSGRSQLSSLPLARGGPESRLFADARESDQQHLSACRLSLLRYVPDRHVQRVRDERVPAPAALDSARGRAARGGLLPLPVARWTPVLGLPLAHRSDRVLAPALAHGQSIGA